MGHDRGIGAVADVFIEFVLLRSRQFIWSMLPILVQNKLSEQATVNGSTFVRFLS